ncbi:FkbM family methyltransferase [Tabrizicola sp. BL-A-41-H6]|uniref:FkbM family methyltransferase n=1 Tax=Tabrizicola sp. BL-A-41-H6 TaxID=3421107 RepID=UPI003D66C202
MRVIEPAVRPDLTISPPGQVVRTVIHGKPVLFFVNQPRDAIQRHHAMGEFYEREELEIIRQWCPPGAVFCDIGANIGNHVLYALTFLNPAKVIVFEPNPVAIAILTANIGLNGGLDRCDLTHLGIGLSDRNAEHFSISAPHRNLGAGQVVRSQNEDGFPLRRADGLLRDEAPSFLKIDVEGMEMAVLAGLSDTIARHRPRIFVEVDRGNLDAFAAWCDGAGYAVKDNYARYPTNMNFLIVPQPAA